MQVLGSIEALKDVRAAWRELMARAAACHGRSATLCGLACCCSDRPMTLILPLITVRVAHG